METITRLLSLFRFLPIWLLAAVTLTLAVVLYAPQGFLGLDLSIERRLPWLPAAFVFCLAALAIRAAIELWKALDARLKNRPRPSLTITLAPQINTTFWGTTKQPDGSLITQISIRGNVLNTTDGLVRIVRARLIRPRVSQAETLPGMHLISNPSGHNDNSSEYPIRPRSLSKLSVLLMVKRRLARDGKFLPVVIGLTDHNGVEHRIRVRLWSINPASK